MNLIAKLDRVFSKYIRVRDCYPNGKFVCISCGKVKGIEESDCGHFISRGNMATRYDERNCNAECRFCNRFDNSHLVGYQRRLINKIGMEEFNKMVQLSHTIKKWDKSELEFMIKLYNAKLKEEMRTKGIFNI